LLDLFDDLHLIDLHESRDEHCHHDQKDQDVYRGPKRSAQYESNNGLYPELNGQQDQTIEDGVEIDRRDLSLFEFYEVLYS